MPKIAFIGAGSTVFTRNLVGDVLRLPELARHDDVRADGHRPGAAGDVGGRRRRLARRTALARRWRRRSTAGAALDGADYVVTSFQVGGYRPATVVDFEVPKRFGLRQTIADTLGVGGIMRGLRTIPVLLDVCRDMEELCPDALLLQYVNPMAMLCWAVAEAQRDPRRSACATPSSTPPASSPPTSAWRPTSRLPRRRHQPPGVLPAPRARRRGPLSRAARMVDEAACRTQPRPLRGAAPLRLLRHRVLRALRRVRALVHQGRPARPDRALQHPARRVPAPLRAQIAEWDALRARLEGAGARSAPSAATSTAPTSSARARPASRSPSTATSPTRRRRPPDRQPARRLLRRGAVHRLGAAASSRSASARCRATSPR